MNYAKATVKERYALLSNFTNQPKKSADFCHAAAEGGAAAAVEVAVISKLDVAKAVAARPHVVTFKQAMEKCAQPEMYICAAEEAGQIQELLATVENEGSGPIGSLSYTEFVKQVAPITLAELRERFADELEAASEEEA
jgi:hypothetical protein